MVKEALALFRKAGADHAGQARAGRTAADARAKPDSLLADARRLGSAGGRAHSGHGRQSCARPTTGLDDELLGARRFDLVVIDEACQSTEPGCWIPLLRADRVVLAGDHCQLPPTVRQRRGRGGEGFGVSLFERLAELRRASWLAALDVQYRMHAGDHGVLVREFYDAASDGRPGGRRSIVLADLPGVAAVR